MKLDSTFDDDEHSQHTPAERAAAASRSTWVSVGVNVVLTIIQIIIGGLSKSQGLIADGIHSLSDLVSDFVVLVANHHSKKDADAGHPYGHHRFETPHARRYRTVFFFQHLRGFRRQRLPL